MTTIKDIIQIIGDFILAGIMLLAAGKMYFVDGGVDLDKNYNITGQIITAYKTTRTTKYYGNLPVFAFTLNNYDHTLGAYRPSGNYKKLLENLKPGDTVTVYFKPRPNDKINIDVYQIKKAGQVVLDYGSYRRNHKAVAVFVGILAALIIVLATLNTIRTKKRKCDL
jgi:hypothetical protein